VKRRRVLIIGVVVFVAAVFVTVLWPEEREPEYQGRKLSKWLEIYLQSPENESEHRRATPARKVLLTSKTGIPCCLPADAGRKLDARPVFRAQFSLCSSAQELIGL